LGARPHQRCSAACSRALSINLDASTNLDSISFAYDGTLATNYIVTVIEPKLQGSHSDPGAEHRPAACAECGPFSDAAEIHAADPGERGSGRSRRRLPRSPRNFNTADVVTASGSLDVLRYGHVFKARRLAAVRGAGTTTTAKYYVKSVTTPSSG